MPLVASNCRRFAQASDRAATQRAGPFNRSSTPGFGNLLEGSWTGFLFSFLFLFLFIFIFIFFFVFQVYVFSLKKMFTLLQKCSKFEKCSCFQILFINSKTVCIYQKMFGIFKKYFVLTKLFRMFLFKILTTFKKMFAISKNISVSKIVCNFPKMFMNFWTYLFYIFFTYSTFVHVFKKCSTFKFVWNF